MRSFSLKINLALSVGHGNFSSFWKIESCDWYVTSNILLNFIILFFDFSAYEPNQNSPSSTTVSIRNRKSTQPSGAHLNPGQLPHQTSKESKATDTSAGCKNNKKRHGETQNLSWQILNLFFLYLIWLLSLCFNGLDWVEPQCYIQWVYKAPLYITIWIRTCVVAYFDPKRI